MFTLESPHRFNLSLWDFSQERVRNSRGKRAISVRAIEVLLYIHKTFLKYSIDLTPSLLEFLGYSIHSAKKANQCFCLGSNL